MHRIPRQVSFISSDVMVPVHLMDAVTFTVPGADTIAAEFPQARRTILR
jgi:hypothetical protein